ncbi:hypothetical protein Fmac_031053 [Flemingia macrophylla]|uniref:DUF7588 domain-containing protein n=1 Tax=Flemingia macrophylla TaxID=520843 RepID=A0ABD1L0Y4_9FABA
MRVWSTMLGYTIDKPALHKEFHSDKWTSQRKWFLSNFKGDRRSEIIESFYAYLNHVQTHVCFFDWFNVYLLSNKIDPPWIRTITEDLSVNVITVWHRKDGKLIKSELPPNSSYFISNLEDKYLASPFKFKSDETIGAQDIKALMEQNNYTNKYLQVFGENLVGKTSVASTSGTKEEDALTISKPLFKPFSLTSQTRDKFRVIRQHWTKSLEASNSLRITQIVPTLPKTSQVGSQVRPNH